MGSNLALNIAEKGHKIAGLQPYPGPHPGCLSNLPARSRNMVVPCKPRSKSCRGDPAATSDHHHGVGGKAGRRADRGLARRHLSANDIIIDAGNANFRDTMRRFEGADEYEPDLHRHGRIRRRGRCAPRPFDHGRRHARILEARRKVLTAISAKYKGEPCAAWLGTDGAGHFVKTIHNGIEYADMQMIAEIYGILRDGLGMKPKEIAAVFAELEQGAARIPT
jgi:6-phosphogluconate dehydrogenase